MIDAVFVLPFVTAALYYLGANAKITQPLWSRYPTWLVGFMHCAACTGFWWGFLGGCAAYNHGIPFVGSTSWWTPFVTGLMSIVWTPVIAAKHERSMTELSDGAPKMYVVTMPAAPAAPTDAAHADE